MQAIGDVTAKLFEMSQSRWHRWTSIFFVAGLVRAAETRSSPRLLMAK